MKHSLVLVISLATLAFCVPSPDRPKQAAKETKSPTTPNYNNQGMGSFGFNQGGFGFNQVGQGQGFGQPSFPQWDNFGQAAYPKTLGRGDFGTFPQWNGSPLGQMDTSKLPDGANGMTTGTTCHYTPEGKQKCTHHTETHHPKGHKKH